MRLIGVVASIAFASLYVQVLVLYGARGLLPVCSWLDSAGSQAGWLDLPTLFRFGCDDTALQALAIAGVVVGLVLAAGLVPRVCLALLWVFYLSFATVGRDFLQFQWDNLLLESLFFAFLVAPSTMRLRDGGPPGRVASFLLLWLVFRLHFESGAAKLLSGDPTWRALTAMVDYYETAPLPTWVGWYAHQLPETFHIVAAVFTLVVELGAPWLLWAGHRLRAVAFVAMVALQAGVILTANYTFFNYLTIVLCLFVLDDDHLPRERGAPRNTPAPHPGVLRRGLAVAGAAVVVFLSFVSFSNFLAPLPGLNPLRRELGTWRTINAYHLFATMTLVRREAVIEGSDDGVHWQPYEFRYKPGDPMRRPRFVAPHQPRVDFRMWFLLLGSRWGAPYFDTLLDRLLHDPPAVASLFVDDPFPLRPPRFLRVSVYRYRFTDVEEGQRTGAWWERELLSRSRVLERDASVVERGSPRS